MSFTSASMTSTSTTISPSLNAATIFLTRPLCQLGFLTGSSLTTLQLFLHSSLLTTSALTTSADASSHRLLLSPSEPAPLPVHLACLASGIAWEDWITVLGGTSFTLVIKPAVVYVVRNDNGKVGVVWSIDPQDISPVTSTLPYDFFARREVFDHLESDSYAGSSSSDADSRPSSRASSFSNFSFKSTSSHSSQSSVASMSSTKSSPDTKAASAPSSVTKYLYQGGVSTVLTGGVMLGGAQCSKPAKQAPSSARPKAAVPSATKPAVYTPPHRSHLANPSTTSSWRRSTLINA